MELASALPEGWIKCWSHSRGKVYYHDMSTKQSQWHPPVAAFLSPGRGNPEPELQSPSPLRSEAPESKHAVAPFASSQPPSLQSTAPSLQPMATSWSMQPPVTCTVHPPPSSVLASALPKPVSAYATQQAASVSQPTFGMHASPQSGTASVVPSSAEALAMQRPVPLLQRDALRSLPSIEANDHTNTGWTETLQNSMQRWLLNLQETVSQQQMSPQQVAPQQMAPQLVAPQQMAQSLEQALGHGGMSHIVAPSNNHTRPLTLEPNMSLHHQLDLLLIKQQQIQQPVASGAPNFRLQDARDDRSSERLSSSHQRPSVNICQPETIPCATPRVSNPNPLGSDSGRRGMAGTVPRPVVAAPLPLHEEYDPLRPEIEGGVFIGHVPSVPTRGIDPDRRGSASRRERRTSSVRMTPLPSRSPPLPSRSPPRADALGVVTEEPETPLRQVPALARSWLRRALISHVLDATPSPPKVLVIGCGTYGGDLRKWAHRRLRRYVGADRDDHRVASIQSRHARLKAQGDLCYVAGVNVAPDLSRYVNKLPSSALDIVFLHDDVLHRSFASPSSASELIRGIAAALADGGVLVGNVADAAAILSDGTLNLPQDLLDRLKRPDQPVSAFGLRLCDGDEDAPCLVPRPTLEGLCSDVGLKLVEWTNHQHLLMRYCTETEAARSGLKQKLGDRFFTEDEWRELGLSASFVFQKKSLPK